MLTFAIIGASGDPIKQNQWNLERQDDVQLVVTEDGHTALTKTSSSVIYLTHMAGTKDFRRLSGGQGYEINEAKSTVVSSRFEHTGDMYSRISMLEYAADGARLGESTISPNTDNLVVFRPETHFIIPAIRLSGIGSIEFTKLDFHSSPNQATKPGPYVQRLETDSIAVDPPSLGIEEVRRQAKALHAISKSLEHSLRQANFENSTSHLSDELTTQREKATSRTGEMISSARERRAKRLIEAMARSLPESNGSAHHQKIPVSAAIITDEYMYNFYRDVFEGIHYLTPDNYSQVLNENKIEVVIYVSCWKGMFDEEWKGVKFREKPKTALTEILKTAKEKSIKTIFQSIEDPSNFDYFLPIAQQFEYIFTSDVNKIEDYIEAVQHDRVYYGEYGANPLINNPIGSFRFDLPEIFFAGSYPTRYQDRVEDMNTLFSSIGNPETELIIADRNFETTDFEFPEYLQPSIIGVFDHATLQKVHKLYRFSANFNSIKTSPTMCAMRVYELQAQGRSILSNYSNSVFNKFPAIRIIAESTELSTSQAPVEWHRERAAAQRSMHSLLTDTTSFDVVSRMMTHADLPVSEQRSSDVLVIVDGDIDQVMEMLDRQKHVPWEAVERSKIHGRDIDVEAYGYIAVMHSDYEYGEYYLASRLNAFKYTRSEFVGQEAYFEGSVYMPGAVHEFASLTRRIEWAMVSTTSPLAKSLLAGDCVELQGDGYLVDPYEIDFDSYLESNRGKLAETDPQLSVIIPVYNNGIYLSSKCVPSLMRNAAWENIEVLLVDDGSTDQETTRITHRLESLYPNIKLYEFNDGGSGSASRPRNFGISQASAPLISFLDPDNEISTGGYDELLRLYYAGVDDDEMIDFVSGYQVKVAGTSRVTGRHASGAPRLVHDSMNEYFSRGKFPVVSTQAAVIRREFLIDSGIEFVEKAAGQDTLFGWELLARSRAAVFTDSAHLIYYAERSDSVTNSVDLKYFQKSLVMETAQASRLRQMGLFDLYVKHHLRNFMVNWYMVKLEKVAESDKPAAREMIAEIANLYGFSCDDFVQDSKVK